MYNFTAMVTRQQGCPGGGPGGPMTTYQVSESHFVFVDDCANVDVGPTGYYNDFAYGKNRIITFIRNNSSNSIQTLEAYMSVNGILVESHTVYGGISQPNGERELYFKTFFMILKLNTKSRFGLPNQMVKPILTPLMTH